MVAKSIDIDPQWRVIKPESPLEVVNQVQSITIEIPDISSWQINGKDKSFIGPDGSIVKIDMELITKDGKSFKMNTIGLGPGLTFSYLPDGKNLVKESRFPRKMVFEKIRIRANRKITGGEVKWICTTNY